MNINDYLAQILLTTNSNTNINSYIGQYTDLFAGLGISGAPNITTKTNLKNQNKVKIKWLNQHLIKRPLEPFKEITYAYLVTILFENLPFAIVRITENTQDYYNKVLIINNEQHAYCSSYLFQFVASDPGPNLEIYDIFGSFSGDVVPHITNPSLKYYDIVGDNEYLSEILTYTEKYN